jgi:SHS2 domain-containing protein
MGYELREHTADVAVEATGESLGATFGAVADGMAAAMCVDWPDAGNRHSVAVTAESRAALLFDYLDELIYDRDIRSVLPVDNSGRVGRVPAESEGDNTESDVEARWHVDGEYRGVPLDRVDARDLKAVTYSEMALEETTGGWRAYVVFDV